MHTFNNDFVYVTDVISQITIDIRYYTANSFVGARIKSYNAPLAILSRKAVYALKKVNDSLIVKGYMLKIYDAYRPQSAVNHFVKWAKDLDDIKMKEVHYPDINKTDLFKLGYISEKSSHSRGSAVDVTVVDIHSRTELDMGSAFDFFGGISHHGTPFISSEQAQNRNFLKQSMLNMGFKAYDREWWHYTLDNEPFPETYFNFPVR